MNIYSYFFNEILWPNCATPLNFWKKKMFMFIGQPLVAECTKCLLSYIEKHTNRTLNSCEWFTDSEKKKQE